MKLFICLILMASAAFGAQKFDWASVLATPPNAKKTEGNQILHFNPANRPYLASEEAVLFVKRWMQDAVPLESDVAVLQFGSEHVVLDGIYVELGVCTGRTINFLAALNPSKKIYGFDSFEGLPEDWVWSDFKLEKGTFAFKDPEMFPPVLHNVVLVKGWFKDVLQEFAQRIEGPIAFLHVDCDLYSSTACAFEVLGDRIGPGAIIVFDELYNYPGYGNHEFKAFEEFLSRRGLKAEYLAYNINHQQVAVKIIQ